MQKTALITGVTGQDGAYLAEFLLDKGYLVHGVKRRSSSFNTSRIDYLYHDPHEEDVRFFLHHGDLTDSSNLIRIIQQTQPDEIYNLAAQSHVAVSFEEPEYTANSDALGALRILEAIRRLQAGSLVGVVDAVRGAAYRCDPVAEAGVDVDANLPDSAATSLIELESAEGRLEHWTGLNNFYVITRYNRSNLYAMAVFQLSELLRAEFEQ